ncbi:MAG: pyrroline-5-carboxylate reductase [Eubacteriales bacterium]
MGKIGFIGTGIMGSAVAQLVAKSAVGYELFFSNPTKEKAEKLAQGLNGTVSENQSIAKDCEIIFLGVKPQKMAMVLGELSPIFSERKDAFVLVSMAAGLSLSKIQEFAGADYPVIRMMPNTPLTVGAGVVQYCATAQCPHLELFGQWMGSGGLADQIPEELMDVATAVSGCGPAFCALFLEALADGGVLCGLPRDKALEYAAMTMVGTGEMILKKKMSPSALKDGVCSPAGSTIRGVAALEAVGVRHGGIQAVRAAYEGSKALGK